VFISNPNAFFTALDLLVISVASLILSDNFCNSHAVFFQNILSAKACHFAVIIGLILD
jgi:hypothetical protein